MGQRPYMSPGPDGWSDQQDTWLSPDGVWKRIEWAQLAGRALAGAIAQPDVYAQAVFGDTLSASTRTAIGRAESPGARPRAVAHVTGVHAPMIIADPPEPRTVAQIRCRLAMAATALPRIAFASPATDRRSRRHRAARRHGRPRRAARVRRSELRGGSRRYCVAAAGQHRRRDRARCGFCAASEPDRICSAVSRTNRCCRSTPRASPTTAARTSRRRTCSRTARRCRTC